MSVKMTRVSALNCSGVWRECSPSDCRQPNLDWPLSVALAASKHGRRSVIERLETVIAAHPFLEDFDERYLPVLREAASLVRFEADEWIFHERETADHFYLIHEGRVALETSVLDRGTTTIQTIGTGDALGWSWLFPPFRWHFGARAIAGTVVIAFRADQLRAKAKEFPEFGYVLVLRVAEVLSQRLRAARLKLVNPQ